MLVSYVYDYSGNQRKPVATIVAIGNEWRHISFTICSTKDRFDKQLGRKIAQGRAERNKVPMCPSRMIVNKQGDEQSMYTVMTSAISNMKQRAERYYKESFIEEIV